jgi:pyrroline-5-carboxylate reductase
MPNVAALVQASYNGLLLRHQRNRRRQTKNPSYPQPHGLKRRNGRKIHGRHHSLSGSGPGYLSIIAEALTYAGLKVACPKHSRKSCSPKMLGTAKLILELPEHPAKIRDMVTTPGAKQSKPSTP